MKTLIDTTMDESFDGSPDEALALAVLWVRDEPGREGELVRVDRDPIIVGREGGEGVSLVRQRPGVNEVTRPLTAARISRRLLRVSRHDHDALKVENLGKAPMAVGGRQRTQSVVHEGDLVEVQRRLLLLCVRRPDVLPGDLPDGCGPFGQADRAGLVGESPTAWALRQELAFVGRRNAHVLLLGESGSGKELAARSIHLHSRRARRPLVSRNAATLPEGLIDAELFGNARNYPNPGMAPRPGLIGQADQGTLFLDEIGEMPPAMQAHLLRVLDEGEYQRLGESEVRRADIRFIAATNRDPEELKHDFLARMQIRVRIAGLDARKEDIPLLVRHLLQTMARDDHELAERFFVGGSPDGEPRIAPGLIRHLVNQSYSTHVRELLVHLWDALTTSRGDTLLGPPEEAEAEPDALTPEQIRQALAEADGVKAHAAELLGLRNRYQLLRLLKRHGLE